MILLIKKATYYQANKEKTQKRIARVFLEYFQSIARVCQVNEERRKKSLKNMKKLYFYKRKYQSNIY